MCAWVLTTPVTNVYRPSEMNADNNKRPRGLDILLGHLPDGNKLGLRLTAM